MEVIHPLLSAGVFIAVFAVGTRLTAYFLRGSRWDRVTSVFYPLAITLGLMAVSPVILGAAVLGWFSPVYLGVAGWIAAPLMRPVFPCLPRRIFRRWQTLLIVGTAILAGAVSLLFSGEHIYGGRDQGFYTNHAIWIARTGATVVDFPLGLSDPELLKGIERGFLNSGLYFSPKGLTAQFPHTYSTWLAQAYSVGGFEGIDAFNGLLAAVAVFLFYALARQCMRRISAAIGSVFLCLSPAQLWISKITLTELFGQQAFLATCLLLALAFRRQSGRLMVAVALTAAFGFLIRIDGMVMLPLMLIGVGVAFLHHGRDLHLARKLYSVICVVSVTTFLACAGYYWIDTRPYFVALSEGILPICALSITACVGVLFVRDRFASITATVVQLRSLRVLLVLALVVTFLWAYLIRPRFDLSLEILGQVSGPEATRIFKINTLWNLGVYLSPLVLAAAVAALATLTLRPELLRSRRFAFLIPVAAVWLGYAVLLIQNPRISIDHPWTIRRFIPVVIPGFILFAFMSLDFLDRRVPAGARRSAMRTTLATILASFVAWATPPAMFKREYEDSREFFTQFASHLPSDAPIFAHGSLGWTLPLMMSFGKPVFFLDLDGESGLQVAQRIAEKTSGDRCVMVHDYSVAPFRNAESRIELVWHFERIRPAAYPIAREWEDQRTRIMIESVADAAKISESDAPRLGAERVDGVRESGFHAQEYAGSFPFRWTRGSAMLEIPVPAGRPVRAIKISFGGIHPKGSDVVVMVNSKRLFSQHLTASEGVFVVEGVNEIDLRSRLVLTIEATPFRPVDLGISTDRRDLGIRILNIELIQDAN